MRRIQTLAEIIKKSEHAQGCCAILEFLLSVTNMNYSRKSSIDLRGSAIWSSYGMTVILSRALTR